MQDFKAGQLIGSNSRNLTVAQLIAAPVGSLATALVYPVLRNKFGIGAEGLSSPISVKWAGFAELLTKGFNAFTAWMSGRVSDRNRSRSSPNIDGREVFGGGAFTGGHWNRHAVAGIGGDDVCSRRCRTIGIGGSFSEKRSGLSHFA